MHKLVPALMLASLMALTAACGPAAPQSAPEASTSSRAATATAGSPRPTRTWVQSPAGTASATDPRPTGTSGSAAPSPSSISLDGATFTTDGYGPLKLGTPATDYPGYLNARATHDDEVNGPRMPDGLYALIGGDGRLSAVCTESPQFTSRAGARAGMSVDALRKLYGSKLEKTTAGTQSADEAWALETGGQSLLFFIDPQTGATVTRICAAITTGDGHIDHRAT